MSISYNLENSPSIIQAGGTVNLTFPPNQEVYYSQTSDILFTATSPNTVLFYDGNTVDRFSTFPKITRQGVGFLWRVTSRQVASRIEYTVYPVQDWHSGVARLRTGNRATDNINLNAVSQTIRFDTASGGNINTSAFSINTTALGCRHNGIVLLKAHLNVTSPGTGARMSFAFTDSAGNIIGPKTYINTIGNQPRTRVLEHFVEVNQADNTTSPKFSLSSFREAGSTNVAVNLTADSERSIMYVERYPSTNYLL